MGSRYEAGVVATSSSSASSSGRQFGALLVDPQEERHTVYTHVGATAQLLDAPDQTFGGGLSIPFGLPLRGESVLFQPMASFGLAFAPTDRKKISSPLQGTLSFSIAMGGTAIRLDSS